jgi:hypothetical protein
MSPSFLDHFCLIDAKSVSSGILNCPSDCMMNKEALDSRVRRVEALARN